LVALPVLLLGISAAQAQSFSVAPVLFPSTGDNGVSPQQVNVTLTAPSTIRSITIPIPLAAAPEFTLVDNGGCVEDGVTVNATGTVCSLVVRFHPAYAGVRTATLLITDGAGNSLAVPIAGTGYYSQITVLPAATRIVAGVGPTSAFATGDGDAAVLASLNAPRDVAADSFGNLYIADTGNNVVRMLDAFGNITTVAGGGTLAGAAADGGLATAASLNSPSWLAVDAAGNLYISETASHVIRRVAMSSSRTITTIAGTYTAGSTGDGSPATTATLNAPTGIAIDPAGNIYIADAGNYRIRRVDGATGYISAFAGAGTSGSNTTSTPAASAQFSTLAGLTLDSAGNLFVADTGNHAVREVAGGNVTVVAGNGVAGSSADGTLATSASLGDIEGVAITPSGDIFFTDATSGLVRKVRFSDGTLETIVATPGKSNGFTAGVRPSNNVSLHAPLGLTFDARFTLYIADSTNNVIRALSPTPAEINFAAQAVGNTSSPLTVRIVNLGNDALSLGSVAAADSTTSSNFVLNTSTADACGTTLAAAAFCSFTVAFAPPASGGVTGEFDITYHPLSNAAINYSAPVLVSGGTLAPLAISPGSLAPVVQGQAANLAITATGYLGTVALDSEGSLPPGISANASSAVLTLSGTPTTVGTYAFTVFATDSVGATVTQAYSLQVLTSVVALNVTEGIHVTDDPSETLPLLLNVSETIHVTDAPNPLVTLALNVNEAIHVTDTSNELLPALLAITESIYVTDTPRPLVVLSLDVNETIHVADAASPVAIQAPQSIAAPAFSNHTYGDAALTVSATSDSGLPVSVVVSGPATLTNGTLDLTGAGTVTLTFSQAGNATYSAATPVTRSFTVFPAAVTITAASFTRAYGQPNPAFTYKVSGLVHGDTATALGGSPVLITAATANSAAGDYPIVPTQGSIVTANYSLTLVPGTLTVTGHVAQTITFSAIPSVPLSVGALTLSAHSTSGLAITYTVTGPATVNKNKLQLTGSGSVTVTASQTGNATFDPATSVVRSFTVTP
jgi:sugar lactone lactonase YvrE